MTLRALISAGLTAAPALLTPNVFTANLICQEPPAMLATSQYLFIVRGDWVFQYDVDTLLLKGRAAIPSGASTRRSTQLPATSIGTDRLSDRRKPVLAKPNANQWSAEARLLGGAGGRYGGRGGGRGGKGGGKSFAAGIDAGLKWLASHQDADGKWDCDGFMKHDAADSEICNGPGNAVHDVGVTALALLAFLGDGSTMRSGPYQENIKRGVRWLRAQQQQNGLFGSNASHDFIYDHAIAAYAMVEAYGLSNYKMLKRSAQQGLNYLESHRNAFSVWRYQPRGNDNDISVTSWAIMAYESGKFFKLQVNPAALKICEAYLDQVSDPTGKHGYTKQGESSSRKPGNHSTRFPVEKGAALSAAGLFCRFFMGQNPKDKPVMKAAADLLRAKPPVWDEKAGSIDHYYWYYASYALFQYGGSHWKAWQKQLETTVVNNQHRDGDSKNLIGSWDPIGVWGDDGGRVYSTAMLTLTLEAYYRYSRLVR